MIHDAENAVVDAQLTGEETNAEQNSKKATVPALTLRVIEECYSSGKDAPSQSQIVDKVIEIKNKELTDATYTFQSQQPSVSRALKKFVATREIIKTADDKYLPYNLETGRALVKEEIIKTVKFGKQPNFTISLSTWLIDVERASIATAKNLFEKYLGPNCYNVLEFNGYLLLLATGSKETRKALKADIDKIREEAINKDNATKKK